MSTPYSSLLLRGLIKFVSDEYWAGSSGFLVLGTSTGVSSSKLTSGAGPSQPTLLWYKKKHVNNTLHDGCMPHTCSEPMYCDLLLLTKKNCN